MVEKRNCSFCGEPIEPGTGKMFVKKDGTVYNFCSNKCKKNRIDLGRVPRRTRWTVRYGELKASTLKRKAARDEGPAEEPEEEGEPKKRPVKKTKARPVPKKAAETKTEEGTRQPSKPLPRPVPKKATGPQPGEDKAQPGPQSRPVPKRKTTPGEPTEGEPEKAES